MEALLERWERDVNGSTEDDFNAVLDLYLAHPKSVLTAAVLAREEAERERDTYKDITEPALKAARVRAGRAEADLAVALELIERCKSLIESDPDNDENHPGIYELLRGLESFLRRPGRLPG